MPQYAMQVPMFNKCSLNCEFCFQNDHGKRASDIDIDYIKSLPKQIMDAHRELFKERKIDTLKMTVYGGDPFSDFLPDEMFDLYRWYYNDFKTRLYAEFPNMELKLIWLSNLVFTKRERVDQLLEDTNGNIYTSYDAVGRFNAEWQRKLWYETLMYYKDRLPRVTVTFIKDNIEKIISGDEYFDKIPKHITIDVSYYLPVKDDYAKFCPSDDLVYRFLKWGLDQRRFNIEPVEQAIFSIIEPWNVQSYCQCYESTYNAKNPDGTIEPILTCHDTVAQALDYNVEGFYKEKDYEMILNPLIIDKRDISKELRGCNYCEYNDHCQKMCFMLQNHINYKTDKICPFLRIYQYIKQHPIIIEDYKIFKEKLKK